MTQLGWRVAGLWWDVGPCAVGWGGARGGAAAAWAVQVLAEACEALPDSLLLVVARADALELAGDVQVRYI